MFTMLEFALKLTLSLLCLVGVPLEELGTFNCKCGKTTSLEFIYKIAVMAFFLKFWYFYRQFSGDSELD